MIPEPDRIKAEQAAADPDPAPFNPSNLIISLLEASNAVNAAIPSCGPYEALANELGTIANALESRAKAILFMKRHNRNWKESDGVAAIALQQKPCE